MTELIRMITQLVAQAVWSLSLFGEVFYYYFFVAGPNALLLLGVIFLFFDDIWDGVAGAIGFILIPISIVLWVAVRSPYLGDVPAGIRMCYQMADHIYQVYHYEVLGMDYGVVFWMDVVTIFIFMWGIKFRG